MKDLNNDYKTLRKNLINQFEQNGLSSLSQTEILSLLLSYASKTEFTENSHKLCRQFSSLNSVFDADSRVLINNLGLDEKSAVLLKLIPYISRMRSFDSHKINRIGSSNEAENFFASLFIGAVREKLAVVCVDKSMKIISHRFLTEGSGSSLNVSLADIAEFAVACNCYGIFIAHNHVSADTTPSANDISTTKVLCSDLQKLGILLIDHVISGSSSACSMRRLCGDTAFSVPAPVKYKIN